MRILIGEPSVAFALFLSAACATDPLPAAVSTGPSGATSSGSTPRAGASLSASRISTESAGSPQKDKIVIRPQSNICVSATVDQRVWPLPVDGDTARNLSGHLMATLRRLYEERTGSSSNTFSGPGSARRQPRFATDHDGANPVCRDSDDDIRITARYGPRPDGTPFIFDYGIEQGAVVRQGFVDRDIHAEWRSGRLERIHKQEPMQAAVSQDLLNKAPFLLNLIDSGY